MNQETKWKEKLSNFKSRTVSVINKIGRKGTVVICAVLLIGTAVLLNVILFDSGNETGKNLAVDMNSLAAGESDESGGEEEAVYNYFAAMQLSRQQARDEAMEVLLSVAESDTAIESMRAEALDGMAQIAMDIENESNIETLILAKGFEQCVAVVNGNTASVIVKTTGLLPSEVAQISEIVYEQAGILPANLKIIEKEV
ncbi:MAG: SpoIIIAH-like family protein [Clostridia bacterium]|nr:SpoIIIAH-like family protein [Clostridia bacterium]